ncbi:2-hydroxyacid dehydrogenase [Priestia taiwanensis]|uniref:Bifunctional glyoxylate/hydroxypyruvate reductase B n=1 Tax=Priestia taiwanensis TaxID=1347902 RepID=A0A917AWZ7_9BACI|nr:D-glycerate dehydrogenase [Priestia taiwanensis]MBM7364694.1 gluconate 2-dehydrogenase [Priestia taiwanensis]GGE78928.1 bifunctional glyoxylate/hydroxypyruvate reductase B [Priestia taiwanensis]
MKKVFVSERIPRFVEEYLRNHCDVERWEEKGEIPRDLLLEKLKDKDGLLMFGESIDEELLQVAPKLQAVSTVSVGYDSFDIEVMRKHGIIGLHTPYVLDDTVADLVVGLMLSVARRIAELDAYVKAGKWNKAVGKDLFGIDMHHKTVGIIGMGRIGEVIAKRVKYGFDMNVLYYNRSRNKEAEEKYGAAYCSLEELLTQSDYVVLMTPLTDETYHLIGTEQFRLMKDSAVFINASRGQTVDEAALIAALQNGEIYGAGIDTFTQEPVEKDNPLLQLKNVVTVPHIGSATLQTRQEMAMVAAKNLVEALSGGNPPYIVKELRS